MIREYSLKAVSTSLGFIIWQLRLAQNFSKWNSFWNMKMSQTRVPHLKSEQPGIKRSKERKDGKKFSFQVLSWRKVEVNFPAFLVT